MAPSTPVEASEETPYERLLANLPGDARALVVAPEMSAAVAFYGGLRPHLMAVAERELGILETDIRNTLGADLRYFETFAPLGLPLGSAFAWFATDGLQGFVFSTPALDIFVQSLPILAQHQPFGLHTGDGEAAPGAPVRLFDGSNPIPTLTLFTHAGVAFVLTDTPVDVGQAFIDSRGAPAAAGARLTQAHREFLLGREALPLHALLTFTDSDINELFQELGLPGDAAGDQVQALRDGLDALALSLSFDANRLKFRVTPVAKPGKEEAIAAWLPDGPRPGFAAIANDDVYAFVRLTLQPELMGSLVDATLGSDWREELTGHLPGSGQTIDNILSSLGPNAIVMLTRARLLSLSRALNSGSPGDFFSALGFIAAVELRNVAEVRTLIQQLPQALGGRVNVYEDGEALVAEFTDAEADIGNLVVVGETLLLVPSRQRVETMAQLADGSYDVGWCDVPQGRGLITQPGQNGLFMDIRRISDGPIGTVGYARLPEEAKRALQRLERITAFTDRSGGVPSLELELRFVSTEDAQP